MIPRRVPATASLVLLLLAAGALDHPWRRLVPAALLACLLWALAYALLGVVSGGLFDDPVAATLVATALVEHETASASTAAADAAPAVAARVPAEMPA